MSSIVEELNKKTGGNATTIAQAIAQNDTGTVGTYVCSCKFTQTGQNQYEIVKKNYNYDDILNAINQNKFVILDARIVSPQDHSTVIMYIDPAFFRGIFQDPQTNEDVIAFGSNYMSFSPASIIIIRSWFELRKSGQDEVTVTITSLPIST